MESEFDGNGVFYNVDVPIVMQQRSRGRSGRRKESGGHHGHDQRRKDDKSAKMRRGRGSSVIIFSYVSVSVHEGAQKKKSIPISGNGRSHDLNDLIPPGSDKKRVPARMRRGGGKVLEDD